MTFGKWVATFVAATAPALVAHDRIGTKVTWEREIAPIVQARCASCHSPGGGAPMPLTTYEETRPWARAIREEVLARRMPKWHVVRGYGDFSNDPSLSPFEIALITAWVDGGAPAFALRASAGRPDDALRPSASATAMADNPARTPTRPTRAVSVPCSATRFPAGEIVGLRPRLPRGGSLRVDVTQAGLTAPLLWMRDYDPQHPETYWLRRPLNSSATQRVAMKGPAPCALTVLLAQRTAR